MRYVAAVMAIAIVVAYSVTSQAAEKNLLIGKWIISNAEVAPWTSEASMPGFGAQAKKYVGLTILFTNKTVLTKDRSLRCRNPSYEVTHFPADALFQSGLPGPDQEKLAGSLGFPAGLIAGVDVNCSAGLFSYHVRPDGRVLFAYDNVIYTLTRR